MSDEYKELETLLHLNGCQQRTAGANEAKRGKEIDLKDMERLEKLTLREVIQFIQANYIKKPKTKNQLQQEGDNG